MVILNGIPGIGKTTHAKEYCSYITKKEENTIVRWIDSDSESKVKDGIKEIIEKIKIKKLDKDDSFDKICHEMAHIIKNDLNGKNLLFVFDNLEDFELIKIFHTKFNNLDNVQMLITTKDNSFNDKLSKYKFAYLKIDFFGSRQAKEYFEKSLKNYIEDKESIIERVLNSEKRNFSINLQSKLDFLPHRLNFIVNYINQHSIFDIEVYLNQIFNKTIWDENDIYFQYFKKIEEENPLSLKILYFMSLMDPDKIQSYLINDLLKDEVGISTIHKAIDSLVRNGFIETFNTEKYFRIHRLTQDVIRLYRKEKGENNNHDIENKLLITLNKLFVCEIDIHGMLFPNEEKCNVLGHVVSLLNLIDKSSFNDHYNHMKLKLNFGIFLIHNTNKSFNVGKSIIDECSSTVNEFYPTDDHIKIKIFHCLAFYHYVDPYFDKASELFDKVLEISRKFYADGDKKSIAIALYCVALIYHQTDRDSEALEKVGELDKIIDNLNSKFLVLSLKIKIKCKLDQVLEAKPLFDELVKLHQSQIYENECKRASDMLLILARSASALVYYEKALEYALDALNIYERHFDSYDQDLCEIYLKVAEYCQKCEDYFKTKEFLNKSIFIINMYSLMDDQAFCVRNLKLIGKLYFFLNQYNEAFNYYSKFHSVIKTNPSSYNSISTAIFLLDLGRCNLGLNKLSDGLQNLEESEEMIKKVSLPGNSKLSKVILEKSKIYQRFGNQQLRMNDVNKANEMFKKQKMLIEEALVMIKNMPEQIKLALTAEIELGKCYKNLEKFNESKEHFLKLLSKFPEIKELKNLKGVILNILGDISCLRNTGDAFKYYEESLQLFKEIYKIHPHIATVSLNLARLWSKSRDENKALKYKFDCLYNLEECYKDLDDLDKVKCLDEIAKSYETLSGLQRDQDRRENYRKLSQENRNKSLEMNRRLVYNVPELNRMD
jgi:tetratricopeptide (TPR) repeat protein